MIWIKASYGAGHIQSAIEQAIRFCKRNDCGIELEFNGVVLHITFNSLVTEKMDEYDRLLENKS